MNKKITSFLLFVIFAVIYYASSFSKISFGDCIGFVMDVEKREFVTDFMPLTHFLYINIAVFFSKFLGIDSVMVMRLMSVLPAAATVSLCYIFVKEFVKEDWIAVMAVFIFGFSFTFWRSASTVEVYTFNAFWVVLFLIYSVKSIRDHSKNYSIIAGIVLGISLWVHIQNIMLIPAYILLLYLGRNNGRKTALSLVSFFAIVLFMICTNYLQDIEIKYLFASKKGPWVQDTFDQGIMDLVKDVVKAIAFLVYNFSVFIILSIPGIIYFYKSYKAESLFLFVASAFTLGFATFYAVSDNYVFFIPFYIIYTLMIALGVKKLSSRYSFRILKFTPALIPFFYILSLNIVSEIPQTKSFDQEKKYKGGLTYYMLPWLHNNIGCIEFTLDNGQTKDHINILKETSRDFIKLRQKYQSIEEIRKL